MINKISRMIKNRKGFTLVELMVVVVIIGILAAIAVPVYNSTTEQAERRAVEANLRTIDGAIVQYQAAHSGVDPDDIEQDLVGSYLQSVPEGPKGASYDISESPARGIVSGTVGGTTLANQTLPIDWDADEE